MRVTQVALRGILDSRARRTVEAELTVDCRHTGRGSAARAIAPGRRERRRGAERRLGRLTETEQALIPLLCGRDFDGQRDFDESLTGIDDRLDLGADLTLSLSLAWARACGSRWSRPLHQIVADLAGTTPALPRPLVNVFSGGIHLPGPPDTFQQIMIIPDGGTPAVDIELACAVYDRLAEAVGGEAGLSASSGLVTRGRTTAWQLEQARTACDAVAPDIALGVDVAAEHLAGDGGYRFEGAVLSAGELGDRLLGLAADFGIGYIEDPFDPADEAAWQEFRPPTALVVGDDLFATTPGRVRAGLAGGILLKPTQAGTLTGTVEAARAARAAGLELAVSHRSGETEDTAMCDLAVGVGAQLIKVGGPRRGDRLAKYNQLLRLAESVAADRHASFA